MVTYYSFRHRDRRLAGLALTLAVHLALVGAWQFARQMPDQETDEPTRAMQWLRIIAPKRAEITPPRPPRVAESGPASGAATRNQAAQPQARADVTPEQAPQPDELAELPVAAPPQPVAESVLERARRDAGAIDRELRKARHKNLITAPVVTAHMRMQQGMELANELAPPGRFAPAKIKEIIDPGGYGRRRYRVITASGTYCMTYESNHAPDGIDTMKNGIKPKMTKCAEHEQPATEQKW